MINRLATLVFVGFSVLSYASEDINDWTPVSWNERSLTLPYLKGFRAEYPSDFVDLVNAEWDSYLTIKVKNRGVTNEIEINRCRDLLEFKISDVIVDSEYSHITQWAVICGAMRRVANMKPYKASFLVSDVRKLGKLLSDVELLGVTEIDPRFLRDLGDIDEVNCKSIDACNFFGTNYRIYVAILAEGDYNGDNIKDTILFVNYGPLTVSGKNNLGIVITKKELRRDVEVIDVF